VGVVGLAAVLAGTPAGATTADQASVSRQVLTRAGAGDWQVVVTAPRLASGLDGAVLEASQGSKRVAVPLDGTPTGRVARGIDGLAYHAASDRLLVLTDQAYDRSGVIVVDLAGAAVVTSVVGRQMTRSPDNRRVAFEQYYVRHATPWPWNETAYAVLDVAAPSGSRERTCPFHDDRCGGVVVFPADRADLCAERVMRTGAPCVDVHRQPQHVRRSPFIWTDPRTLAFVTLDENREAVSVVTSRFDAASATPVVTVVPCDAAHLASAGECPSPRESWWVDTIRVDDDGSRVWVHFRQHLPAVPSGWLAVTRR
jgi:hypothetical protein